MKNFDTHIAIYGQNDLPNILLKVNELQQQGLVSGLEEKIINVIGAWSPVGLIDFPKYILSLAADTEEVAKNNHKELLGYFSKKNYRIILETECNYSLLQALSNSKPRMGGQLIARKRPHDELHYADMHFDVPFLHEYDGVANKFKDAGFGYIATRGSDNLVKYVFTTQYYKSLASEIISIAKSCIDGFEPEIFDPKGERLVSFDVINVDALPITYKIEYR